MRSSTGNSSAGKRSLGLVKLKPCCAHAVKPLAFGVPVAVTLFGVYELLEWLFMAERDTVAIHLLHLFAGIVFSLLIAATVSWSIINSSPGFIPDTPREDSSLGGPMNASDRTKRYAEWFIAMRWIAVLLASALVITSVRFLHWLPEEVWWPLIAALGALVVSNVVYSILLRCEQSVSSVLQFQGYLDLVVLTALLHFSGGIENPLSMMMVFHIIIGGVLLPKPQSYLLAAFGSLLFAVMAWMEWADVVEHYTLMLYPHFKEATGELFHPAHNGLYACSRIALHTTVLFLTAYFVTSLAERLRQKERRLEAMAERAMADQQLLERALETTGTALRVLGPEDKTHWSNARWQTWFGSAADPKQLDDFAEPSPARSTFADGQTRLTEFALAHGPVTASRRGRDGTRVVQVTTAPIRESGGKVRQVVELAQDITAQKQAQAQFVRAGQLSAVGELAGQVAHEVNNPIAIISAKARLLLSDHRRDMSPKVAQELEKITDLSDRVAEIAQGLLSYCRPSAAIREPIDVCDPIRKCLALVDQHARKAGVTIHDHLPHYLPKVKANAQELEQVFLNLVINALDAMPDGGDLGVAHAPTTLMDRSRGIAITVSDTGAGIAPEIRERIFEPFFTTKKDRGTGLGLSIGLGLIRGLGGDIVVESESGKGARFTVILPIYPAKGEKGHA